MDAEERDIPQILELMEIFYHESCFSVLGKIDNYSLSDYLLGLINRNSGILLVYSENGAIIGFIGGALVPFFANNDILICQEAFWFVHPNHRGYGSQMLEEFELRAVKMGAHALTATSIHSNKPNSMERLYKRKGFSMMEHGFLKDLRKC